MEMLHFHVFPPRMDWLQSRHFNLQEEHRWTWWWTGGRTIPGRYLSGTQQSLLHLSSCYDVSKCLLCHQSVVLLNSPFAHHFLTKSQNSKTDFRDPRYLLDR